MDGDEVADHYFTYDGRLASFHSAQPVRRRSNAKGRAPKALTWPHRRLDPASLAQAGFYFDPEPEFTDNVVCFLCHKRVGGWDEGDNPIEEHLRLSPHCGWAIVAAIEAGVGDYNMDDPSHPDMMEARKATFTGRWPHEGKKGWKCKIKQMVDAGWKHTPTIDSEDMATCTYCQLALDGWEPKDQPMHEHYKRSPECPFFILINQYQQGPAKKTGRAKGARASKASRVSAQSVATLASDVTSFLEHPADHEDSVMTTTSVMTAGGTKRGRPKKATAAKGKKTRGKKDEPIEVLEDPPEEEITPPPPPKPTRGRKRTSEAVDDSVLTNAEAPAPKKRAGRTRGSAAVVELSILEPQHEDIVDAVPAPPAKVSRKKGRVSNNRARKASIASTTSVASFRSADEHAMDDDEIDRQLLADLDRPLSDDGMLAADSDSERKKGPAAKGKGKKAAVKKSTASQDAELSRDHAMFDPSPVDVDDADISAELKDLRIHMEVEKTDKLVVPKKGRKAATTRKVSKQTKKGKAAAQPEPEPEPERVTAVEKRAADSSEDELSMMSNATVIKKSMAAAAPASKKRGRPKKTSTQSQAVEEDRQPETLPKAPRMDSAETVEESTTPPPPAEESTTPPPPVVESTTPPPPSDEQEPHLPSTPQAATSPAPAARPAVISPSRSPQSSDAENQPPSSRPSNAANSSQLAPAPVEIASTPIRSSPIKRNVNIISGLQSSQPWSAVDLDVVFDHLSKENVIPDGSALEKGLQLTSPEKKMTVEEWIYHNAGLAEARLKGECEAMVSKFESEGGRAMSVLEGLVAE
ncbi:uncharacterized protein BCR38DRAFT_408599 [Pseudomassariella vexata]|uniref:Uncharacterized protein n=1 Tax=Pseudomassariella vexata TaxID=1141098 RepID=A0A1Y2E1T9_9PEZI|nr:uncharacterized protein BCR38DRAFT_408599 [Pseudomassariella vexata]ORY64835.1 hypothetical protein BCR38DRAFT_408599 [Pseudomassariella vexata]